MYRNEIQSNGGRLPPSPPCVTQRCRFDATQTLSGAESAITFAKWSAHASLLREGAAYGMNTVKLRTLALDLNRTSPRNPYAALANAFPAVSYGFTSDD